MRVLMLGGACDEVVPRSQMQELWEIIRSRGRVRDAEKPSCQSTPATKSAVSTGEKAKAAAARGKTAGGADDGAKVPPCVLTDGGNTYIEFSAGMHSTWLFLPSFVRVVTYSACR